MQSFIDRFLGVSVVALAVGCGGGASSTTEPTTETESSGAETETSDTAVVAEEPPAPASSRLRVIHTTSEPAAAAVSVSFDVSGAPVVDALAYRSSTGYLDTASGHHSILVRGPAGESGEGPTLGLASDDLEPGHSYTAFFFSQASVDSPFALLADEDTGDVAEGDAQVRFFHGLVGTDDIDVCVAGATARADAESLFADVQPTQLGSAQSRHYVDVTGGTELVLQIRAQASPACHGRVAGVARFTPAADTSYTLVAIGRTTGRPRADRELLVCADAPADGSCTPVPIAAR